ncbi:3-oxoacyl-[acyl-carrier protein] reductase [Streptomyces sp. MnatMP-M77]|uniref:SDR family oxidoreductase n=1 Tax=unclassified Streptomyces TaxID=2593676 RepID=UPI00080490C5|nr:SDR family oxidoreductase [Streptomyces sp. MnatMP-M77]MYT80368.1 SDR family oxidoreductase [Streptomyces sp. SID8364]SBU99668.1 3-oxoacyl-[acyl-carrier protein] reductase [Streptomyces sp. MnatMP-M77]
MTNTEQRPPASGPDRPIALITGVGRSIGIGAGIARRLAVTGWDVAFTYWTPYDRRMEWGAEPGAAASIEKELAEAGARTAAIEADLTDPDAPARIFDEAEQRLGGQVTALVLSHAESVDSGLLDTTVEAFDRHFAVNSRASWLLIREYGLRFRGAPGTTKDTTPSTAPGTAPGTATGRIVALTSDHTVGNLPYGASKGALDRITLAAAHELAHLGVTANVVNPGPVDTGWMNDELRETLVRGTPLGRLGTPLDTAHLVGFLCSPEGQWVNGQLLKSNGGAAS